MGKIIVVLTRSGTAKTDFINQSLNTGQTTFCSYQTFVQDKLSVKENLALMAAWYGVSARRVTKLLEEAKLEELGKKQGGSLPQVQRRILSWSMALLPTPHTLVVDDLALGLSQPAQQTLWQVMRDMVKKSETTVLYVTDDLEAIAGLEGEVWFLEEDGVLKEARFPAGWESLTLYEFTVSSQEVIEEFIDEIQQEAATLGIEAIIGAPSGSSVQVLVNDAGVITDFFQATKWVIDFQSLPLLMGSLPAGWDAKLEKTHPVPSPLPPLNVKTQTLTSAQQRQAIWHIALTEWRFHFRNFWYAGNLLFSAIYSLLFFLMALENAQNSPETAPLLLGMALASSALFSTAWLPYVIGRWRLPAQSNHAKAEQWWALLTPFVLVPAGQKTHLRGLYLGQFLLTCIHAVLFWSLFSLAYSTTPSFIGLSFLFWLLMTGFGLTIGLFIGQVWPWPRTSPLIGPFFYLLSLFAIAGLNRLPRPWWPLTWWWPPAALIAAWERLLLPTDQTFGTVALPLSLMIGLTSGLAWVLWRRFSQLKV